MKMLRFRVTDEQYQELKTISSEKGCRSAHEFLKDIALASLSKDKKIESNKNDLYRDDLAVNMRFNVDEVTYDKISESAKKHGWTLSKEIRFRLNQTLSREPVMLENEIRELRKTRREGELFSGCPSKHFASQTGVMMGVKVKKEDRIRRVAEQRREKIRRFPEAHKARHGDKNYSRGVRDRAFKNGNSREVLVRITGSGRTLRGVKNEINYIAREGELTLRDSEGKEYCIQEREERKQSYAFMTDHEDKQVHKDESAPKLVHNMVFSSPNVASVSEADAFKAVETTLKEKYPDNRFIMAYHKDTDSHHLHVLLRIPDNYGKRINIRKQDLRDLREKFAGQLQKRGIQCDLYPSVSVWP